MNFPVALIVVNFELGISSKNKFRSRIEAFNWLKDELGMSLEELQNLELNIQWKKDYIHIYMIEW